MVVLMGKTASGKTTILNKMVSDMGFNQIITYTTRPIRKGEKNGKTYHFISNEDFLTKIEDRFFAEWKVYHTIEGDWYYGVSYEDISNSNDKSILIATPQGIEDLKALEVPMTVIYIYANRNTMLERLKARGDSKDEAERRIEADALDFKDKDLLSDRIVYNNSWNTLDEVMNKIKLFLERG